MGYPFDTPTWDAASGAIFMGAGGALPGLFTLIAIVICVLALALGQAKEAAKYKNHK
ncbi:hypothetical protein SAMN05443432_103210 [Roseovarius litoreus]|jgi:hypothetical protein|uniref:Uncharacterized protein n=1 Tax=Roseovarius litoreus TaxID=1155722 RepID=A0A1M7E5K0_9RHOB|nr:hypothetical protein [Roseovarius litoreus]SHL86987.1 hypothetical protein SAMN05443432_103210 [Roseovarius litoreus]